MRQKKEFTHNKTETCSLSKQPIDTTKENYAVILDCQGKEIRSIKFYKQRYLIDLIKGNVEKITEMLMKRTQNVAKGMLGNVLGRTGLIKEQYEIKG